jgi:hypothetical protein
MVNPKMGDPSIGGRISRGDQAITQHRRFIAGIASDPDGSTGTYHGLHRRREEQQPRPGSTSSAEHQ